MKLLLALATCIVGSQVQADVIVVDASGSGDFLEISQASNAANDGDTLLVKPGIYSSFIVNDKSLDVVADGSVGVVVSDYAAVINLAAHREVLISGFEVRSLSGVFSGAPLFLQSNLGSVRVMDVEAFGQDGWDGGSGFRGGIIDNCADVALAGCDFYGGNGGLDDWCTNTAAGTGLDVFASQIVVSDCFMRGGLPGGYSISWDLGGDGGMACNVDGNSTAYFYHSSFLGGNGGSGDSSFTFCSAGSGGAGLRVTGSSAVTVLDSTAIGGSAGIDSFGPNGALGIPISGPVTNLTGKARRLITSRVVREGGAIQFSVFGELGDTVYMATSLDAGFLHAPALTGTWLTATPSRISFTPLGAVGANGMLQGSLPWSVLPPGLEERHLQLQPLVFPAGGGQRLGLARTTVIVDAGF